MTYTFTQEDFCCSHCDENQRSTLIGAVLKSNNVWAMSIPVAYTVSWKSRNAFHTRIHIKRKCHAMWWLFSDDNSKRFQLPYHLSILDKNQKNVSKTKTYHLISSFDDALHKCVRKFNYFFFSINWTVFDFIVLFNTQLIWRITF